MKSSRIGLIAFMALIAAVFDSARTWGRSTFCRVER